MGSVITAAQVARSSYYQYTDNELQEKKGRSISNGQRLRLLKDDVSGFSASMWKIGNNYYVGFEGANPGSMADIATDLGLGTYQVPETWPAYQGPSNKVPLPKGIEPTRKTQWGFARKFMRNLAKDYPGVKFTLAGLSLGGTLAQYVSNEPNVDDVFAFNAPGLPVGRRDPRVKHYLSQSAKTKFPGLPEFQIVGEIIEGHGKRVWNGKKYRVDGAKGHGNGDTFARAFEGGIDYRLREAEQRLVDGVVSRSLPGWKPGSSKVKRGSRAASYPQRNNNDGRDAIRRIYQDTFQPQ